MNKVRPAPEAVAVLRDGMTIGIGGWGARRKPMALVREIVRAGVGDLTVVSFGGPDVGLLCAAGAVRKLVFGFVSLDVVPLDPHFRRARESGTIAVDEYDEGMVILGLRAAAMRVPFLPTRAGLGTAVMDVNPALRTVTSPYGGEVLVAMPALPLDVALVHVDEADRLGNTRIAAADAHFDELFVRAAGATVVSAETVVDRLADGAPAAARNSYFERSFVRAVVEAPGGAHPTACPPLYGWDAAEIARYADAAKAPDGWHSYRGRIGASEGTYVQDVGGMDALRRHPVAAV